MTVGERKRLAHVPTALYRFYDAAECLLYVGITQDLDGRWSVHSRIQPWWLDVARRDFEWIASREEADRAEARAIVHEKPVYNRTHSQQTNGVWEQRMQLEMGRAVEAVRKGLRSGEYPRWSVLPSYGALSKQFAIPIVGLTRGLSHLAAYGDLVYSGDTFAVASRDDFPGKAVQRYSLIYLLLSGAFSTRPFTLSEASEQLRITRETVARHCRQSGRIERLAALPGSRAARYRIAQMPEAALPDRKVSWSASERDELADWICLHLRPPMKGSQDLERERRIIDAARSQYYPAVLLELAFGFADKPDYRVEWLPERVDMATWLASRELARTE